MQNEQKNYWFKRRRYGYGWVPVTIEGWLLILGYIAVITIASFPLWTDAPPAINVISYLAFALVLTVAFLFITYKKGPKPRWRWGKSETDIPHEDW